MVNNSYCSLNINHNCAVRNNSDSTLGIPIYFVNKNIHPFNIYIQYIYHYYSNPSFLLYEKALQFISGYFKSLFQLGL